MYIYGGSNRDRRSPRLLRSLSRAGARARDDDRGQSHYHHYRHHSFLKHTDTHALLHYSLILFLSLFPPLLYALYALRLSPSPARLYTPVYACVCLCIIYLCERERVYERESARVYYASVPLLFHTEYIYVYCVCVCVWGYVCACVSVHESDRLFSPISAPIYIIKECMGARYILQGGPGSVCVSFVRASRASQRVSQAASNDKAAAPRPRTFCAPSLLLLLVLLLLIIIIIQLALFPLICFTLR